jgi:hypothetical protein
MSRHIKKEGAKTLLAGKEYTPASLTNVQDTWRKFGWVPSNRHYAQSIDLATIYKSKGQ